MVSHTGSMTPDQAEVSKKVVGERLKATRLLIGLNQRDFAQRLGTSGAYISCVELGHSMPGGRFLRCLHREFDININWLLSGQEPDLPPRYGFHIKTLIVDYVHAPASGKTLVMAVASYLAGQGACTSGVIT
ncbi:helix-turn-helix domain-containing protein [Herbaspirillum sp. NPDC087042]|uniref:helix-turn-helix domain-containing protein n=1 Tax=Herbaspirillum sp. NPDC087042 TaxID=3364004 RepID=UPI0037F3F283